MAYLLLIETSSARCSIALSKDNNLLDLIEKESTHSHAAQIIPFIQKLLSRQYLSMQQLDAIAISQGPGSYTGLRIGLSTAKGLCYALNKPLIAIDTLAAMAAGMTNLKPSAADYYCPMIDARRDEVYAAVFSKELGVIRSSIALQINKNSFADLLKQGTILFFGNGAEKCRELIKHEKAQFFSNFEISSAHMVNLSYKSLITKEFQNLAYFEPDYLKAFFTKAPKRRHH